MRKVLIATLIGLSTLILSQSAKADSSRSYRLAYEMISTSSNSFESEETREYVLKWLKQDKNYPHKLAISYCQDRHSGFSKSRIIENISYNLQKRKLAENWSTSRLDAYVKICSAGVAVGLKYYCPEFVNTDINK